MSRRRPERIAAAGGAMFALCFLGGFVMEGIAVGGAEEDSRAEVVARFSDSGNELWAEVGSLLMGFAIVFLLMFVAALRALLETVDRERRVLAAAAFGGGVAMAALLAVASAANVAAAFSSYDFYDAYEVPPDTALLMLSVSFYAQGYAMVGGAVLVGATSIVALRARLLPRWLGVAGLALAVLLAFGEWALFFAFPIPALLLWTVFVGVLLTLRGNEAARRFETGLETRAAASQNP